VNIGWFPRLRFCGRYSNHEFTITITITNTIQSSPTKNVIKNDRNFSAPFKGHFIMPSQTWFSKRGNSWRYRSVYGH